MSISNQVSVPREVTPVALEKKNCGEKGSCVFKKAAHATHQFFFHCYADARLFFRALVSMGRSTDRNLIAERIQSLREFQAQVERPADQRAAVAECFNRLSPQLVKLLFTTNSTLIGRYVAAVEPSAIAAIRSEILRDCRRAESLQRHLQPINSFIRAITCKKTVSPPAPQNPIQTSSGVQQTPPLPHLEQLTTQVSQPTSTGTQALPHLERPPAAETPRIWSIENLSIVGVLPQEIVARRQEIERLFAQWEQLPETFRRPIPGYMFNRSEVNHPTRLMMVPIYSMNDPVADHPDLAVRVLSQPHWDARNLAPMVNRRGQVTNGDSLRLNVELQCAILAFFQEEIQRAERFAAPGYIPFQDPLPFDVASRSARILWYASDYDQLPKNARPPIPAHMTDSLGLVISLPIVDLSSPEADPQPVDFRYLTKQLYNPAPGSAAPDTSHWRICVGLQNEILRFFEDASANRSN